MGILRYEEQTLNLIKELYSPFDIELEALTSLCVSDYIDFYYFITSAFRESLEAPQKIQEEIVAFLDTLNPNSKNINNEYKRLLDFASRNRRDEYQSVFNGMNTVCITDIITKFGQEKGHDS